METVLKLMLIFFLCFCISFPIYTSLTKQSVWKYVQNKIKEEEKHKKIKEEKNKKKGA